MQIPGAKEVMGEVAKELLASAADYARMHGGNPPTAIASSTVPKAFSGWAELGDLTRVGYLTKKGNEVAEWEHVFGRETDGAFYGPRPRLVVGYDDEKRGHLVILRGQSTYRITGRGIVG